MNHHGRQFSAMLAVGTAFLAATYAPTQGYGAYAGDPRYIEQPGQSPSVEQDRQETPTVSQDRIHPDVYANLKKSTDGRAYVIITLQPVDGQLGEPEQTKALINKRQDEVLGKMGPGEFKLVYRYQSIPVVSGFFSAPGLAKLGTDPNVRQIGLDLPMEFIRARAEVEKPKPGQPWTLADGPIHPDVYKYLQESLDGNVYGVVTLAGVTQDAPRTEKKKAALIKKRQDNVLARMAAGEFKVRYRSPISGLLAGYINAAALMKLAEDPDVVAVHADVPGLSGAGLPIGKAPAVEGSPVVGGAIHTDVYKQLDKTRGNVACVLIELKLEAQEGLTPEQRKEWVRQVQDKVLGKLTLDDLQAPFQFEDQPKVIAYCSEAGIGKLKHDPDVLAVKLSKASPKVYRDLRASEDGTVKVSVALTPVGRGEPLWKRKPVRNALKDRVLIRLDSDEYSIVYWYEGGAGMALRINAAGLAKLLADPDVIAIGANLPVNPFLGESVPFIRADLVQVDLGVTGRGVTRTHSHRTVRLRCALFGEPQ